MFHKYSELNIQKIALSRGYNIGPVYHGTKAEITEFSSFRPNFFAFDRGYANMYTYKGKGKSKILSLFLKAEKILDTAKNDIARQLFNEKFPEYFSEKHPRLFEGKSFWKISQGQHIPFQWADEFFSFLRAWTRKSGPVFDSMLVDEGGFPEMVGSSIKESIIPLYNTQIKLADLTTYDDKGGLIPLSERFNPNTPDIRY